jgi:hypothetical protein
MLTRLPWFRITSGDVPNLEKLYICSNENTFVNEQIDPTLRENERIFVEFVNTITAHPTLALVCFGQFSTYTPELYPPTADIRRILGERQPSSESGDFFFFHYSLSQTRKKC